MKKIIPDGISTRRVVQVARTPIAKPLGDLCLEIAEFAKDRDYPTLDYLMRMAAEEAYSLTSEPLSFSIDWNVGLGPQQQPELRRSTGRKAVRSKQKNNYRGVTPRRLHQADTPR